MFSAAFTQDVFLLTDFIQMVENYHPVAKQAGLLEAKGAQTIRSAKGAFDPVLFAYWDEKDFNEKDYYRNFSSGVKGATPLGVSFKAGYDNSRGDYVNPENGTPEAGLMYAGIGVPLGQGLWIDKRRAALQQAEIYAASTQAERQLILNNLLSEAVLQYWKWVKSTNDLKVYESAIELAATRFVAVKESYLQGDKPAIDTLEALIQWQNRLVQWQEATVYARKASWELANYLWSADGQPLQMKENVESPQLLIMTEESAISADSVSAFIANMAARHPAVQLYDFKLQNLAVEQKLKRDKLKPKLDVQYNFLADPSGEGTATGVSVNNFKWGLAFSMPVALRTARSDIQLNDIKIQETNYALLQKQQELVNKVQYYAFQLDNLKSQIALSKNNVKNYAALLAAERQKLEIGESSLFLINSRENKLIEAQLKLMSLKAKFQEAEVLLGLSLGGR